MNKRIKTIIAVAVVILAAGVGLSSLFTDGGMISYVSFNEARATTSNVQVMGEILAAGTSYEPETGSFSFYITDEAGDKMKVVYSGTKPGNFDQATSVVCIGNFQEDTFHANKLLVKCPSKYQETPTEEGA